MPAEPIVAVQAELAHLDATLPVISVLAGLRFQFSAHDKALDCSAVSVARLPESADVDGRMRATSCMRR